MAKTFVFKDLTAEQLESIKHPHPKKGQSSRDLLASYLNISDPNEPKQAISLDLYSHTLQFAQSLKMGADKMSGLLSIVKYVHLRSTGEKMQVERSFKMFKDQMMTHSVQRPPYSIGLFTYQEMMAVTNWFLDSYYRHYKLYMYAFTDRVLMNVTQHHPLDIIELPLGLQPLNDAMDEEAYAKVVDEETRQKEEEAAAEAIRKAEEDEAARLARLREEYEASIPEEVKEKVAAALERELELLKKNMEEKFEEQQGQLRLKIEELEARVPQ